MTAGGLWVAVAVVFLVLRVAATVVVVCGKIATRVVVAVDAVVLISLIVIADPRALFSLALPIIALLLLMWLPASQLHRKHAGAVHAVLLVTAIVATVLQAGVAHVLVVQAAAARTNGEVCLPPSNQEGQGLCDLPPG